MKITDKRKMIKEYGELNAGDCFQLDDGIYIKTDVAACFEDMYAVRLDNGRMKAIKSTVAVTPVEAELLVR